MKHLTLTAAVFAVLAASFAASALVPETPENVSEMSGAAVGELNETGAYGERLFHEGFEYVMSVSNGGYLSGVLPEKFGGQPIRMNNGGVATDYALAEPFEKGDIVLSLGGSSQYPQIVLYDFTVSVPGTYTLTFDYYVPSSLHLDFFQAGLGNTSRLGITYDKWTSVTLQRKLEAGESFGRIPIQACKSPSNTTAYYLDNIDLYYKAPSANITCFIMNGEGFGDVEQTLTVAEDDTVALPTEADYEKYRPDGTFLAGFYAGDGYVSPGSMYKVTAADIENGELYITPDFRAIPLPEYGTPVFFTDFSQYVGQTILSGSSLGKVKSEYGTGNYTVYNVGTASTYTVEDVGGVPMLGISGSFMYPQMRLANLGITKPGMYTLVCDYYLPADSKIGGLNIYANTQTGVKNLKRGTLTTNVMSYGLGEGNTLNTIAFEAINPQLADSTVYITNLYLYYVETKPITINFYADAAGTTLRVTDSIRYGETYYLPDADMLAEYTPAGMRLIGFSVNGKRCDVSGSYTVTLADNTAGLITIKPIYVSDVEPDASLVFAEDFTTYLDTDLASGQKIAETPSAYGSGNIVLYNVGTASTYHASVVNGTPMLGISGAVPYPQLRIASMGVTKPGLYTLECDYYLPSDCPMTGLNIYVGKQTGAKNFTKGTLVHNTMTYALAEGGSISFIGIEGINTSSAPCTFYIGNITLRYAENKPISVTVYADGEKTVTLSEMSKALGESFTLPTSAAFAGHIPADMRLAGLAVGEKRLAPGASYTVGESDIAAGGIDILPLFEEMPVVGYGTMLFMEGFDNVAAETLIFNNGANGTHTAVYSNSYIPLVNSADAPMNAYTFCVSRGANLMSSYIYDLDGNHVVAVDQTGLLPHFGVYGGASNSHQSLNITEAGVYTVMADFCVPSVFASSVKTMYPRVYMRDGSFINGVLSASKVSGDTWYNGKITFERAATDSPIDYILFIAETYTGNEGITFYTDNIAMFYTESASPVSIKLNSVRTANPNGLRYLAFVSTVARNMASEYGFLVTVDDKTSRDYTAQLVLDDGERKENEMVTNAYGVRLISSSNYEKNRKDLVYATDDENLPDGAKMGSGGVYYAATMTGIPEKGYHDTVYARPFLRVNGKTLYGEVVGTTLYDAAAAYKASPSYVENEFIESILVK